MGDQFNREILNTMRIRKVKSIHREPQKQKKIPGKYLRMTLLRVRVGFGDSACEAAGREPLHYIPSHSAKLRVKATEKCGASKPTSQRNPCWESRWPSIAIVL